jgi:hypothetical protein
VRLDNDGKYIVKNQASISHQNQVAGLTFSPSSLQTAEAPSAIAVLHYKRSGPVDRRNGPADKNSNHMDEAHVYSSI